MSQGFLVWNLDFSNLFGIWDLGFERCQFPWDGCESKTEIRHPPIQAVFWSLEAYR
jgi:hypothetical protein